MTDTAPTPTTEAQSAPEAAQSAVVPETAETLTARAEAIVKSLEGVAYHDALKIFNYVSERIVGAETREASIVKTKFEEAILWMRRHFEKNTATEG